MDQHKEKPTANGARNLADEELTRAVLASFGDSKSERFRQVVQSLVRYLHAFVKEVEHPIHPAELEIALRGFQSRPGEDAD